jgi:hypothetical protein
VARGVAGLDPQRPPRAWPELEDAARRLARRSQADELEVLGFNPAVVPWWWWVWQLGGEVVDPSGERVVLDRGDAFLAHQTEQAWHRRFFPAVPGLSDILPIGSTGEV